LQRSAAAKIDTVKCASTTNGSIEVKQSPPNVRTSSNFKKWVNFIMISEEEKEKGGKSLFGFRYQDYWWGICHITDNGSHITDNGCFFWMTRKCVWGRNCKYPKSEEG